MEIVLIILMSHFSFSTSRWAKGTYENNQSGNPLNFI